jgi:hypothetical protein
VNAKHKHEEMTKELKLAHEEIQKVCCFVFKNIFVLKYVFFFRSEKKSSLLSWKLTD